MANYTNASIDRLMRVVSMLKTPEECRNFFYDLCTIKELQNMAMRLDTAIMLSKGENYMTISREVGSSAATISRVSRSYHYGSDGYKQAVQMLEDMEVKQE